MSSSKDVSYNGFFSVIEDTEQLNVSNRTPSELLFLAQLAEKTESYSEMHLFVRQMASQKTILDEKERAILAAAYKNVVTRQREGWHTLWDMLQKEEIQEKEKIRLGASTGPVEELSSDDLNVVDKFQELLDEKLLNGNIENDRVQATLDMDDGFESAENMNKSEFLDSQTRTPLTIMARKVRGELEDICYEFIDLIKSHLLIHVPTDDFESNVFYKKLIGDYYRYLSEYCKDGQRRQNFISEADEFYSQALELSKTSVLPTNSLKLGLCLNVSVFYFEILQTPDKACELAKTAYDEAVAYLGIGYEEEEKKDQREVRQLMDLLKVNLKIWTESEFGPQKS